MISLHFTVNEINAILDALSKFPYEQVKLLIENIHNQATPQLQPVDEAEKSVIALQWPPMQM